MDFINPRMYLSTIRVTSQRIPVNCKQHSMTIKYFVPSLLCTYHHFVLQDYPLLCAVLVDMELYQKCSISAPSEQKCQQFEQNHQFGYVFFFLFYCYVQMYECSYLFFSICYFFRILAELFLFCLVFFYLTPYIAIPYIPTSASITSLKGVFN